MLLAAITLLPSCHRSSREMWEDTKTCNRYMKKGFTSLFGRHVDKRGAPSIPKWNSQEPEFLALTDDSRYTSSNMNMNEYPISKESPGDPGSSIPGIDAFAEPSGELARLFNKIHFETDKYTVNGTENIETLHQIADHLVKHPNMYVFVEGHADERGAASYNLALGAKRSNSVRGFLIEKGVSPNQLFTISYGKERPVALGQGEECWHQNRRAEFKVYEK